MMKIAEVMAERKDRLTDEILVTLMAD